MRASIYLMINKNIEIGSDTDKELNSEFSSNIGLEEAANKEYETWFECNNYYLIPTLQDRIFSKRVINEILKRLNMPELS
ncbi:MAG: hypothetical protein ACOC56_00095 [Atribacterota bacterium]